MECDDKKRHIFVDIIISIHLGFMWLMFGGIALVVIANLISTVHIRAGNRFLKTLAFTIKGFFLYSLIVFHLSRRY